MSSTLFDYTLEVGDPTTGSDNVLGVRNPRPGSKDESAVYVPMTIKVMANANTKAVGDYFLNTIKSISFRAKDIRPFSTMGMKSYAYYSISFNEFLHKGTKNMRFGTSMSSSPDAGRVDPRPQGRQSIQTRPTKAFVNEPMFFCEKIDGNRLNNIFLSAVYGFEIHDNLGNTYSVDLPTDIKDEVRMNPSSGEFMFDEVAAGHPLITGVYSVSRDYGGAARISELLEDNSQFVGIVSSNLKYAPGKEIYSIRKTIVLDKETVYKITGFEISPVL